MSKANDRVPDILNTSSHASCQCHVNNGESGTAGYHVIPKNREMSR